MHLALDKDFSVITYTPASRRVEIVDAIKKTCLRLTEGAAFCIEKGEESKGIHLAEYAVSSAVLLKGNYRSSSTLGELCMFWEKYDTEAFHCPISLQVQEFLRRLRFGEINAIRISADYIQPHLIPQNELWPLYLQTTE